MKTNQNLIRKMGDFDVIQRTADGYFDGNALLQQWNKSGISKREMKRFLESNSTQEFMNTIKKREAQQIAFVRNAEFQSVVISKSRSTKSGRIPDKIWMHPYLFIDFAMWINPEFKYDVIQFVYDQLIQYRHDAGDTYRDMACAIKKIAPKDQVAQSIQNVAKAINYIVFNQHESEIRNKRAEVNKMRELYEIERDIVKLINDGFIRSYDALIKYLRKKWQDKYVPRELVA
jgi:hypothetical protein